MLLRQKLVAETQSSENVHGYYPFFLQLLRKEIDFYMCPVSCN